MQFFLEIIKFFLRFIIWVAFCLLRLRSQPKNRLYTLRRLTAAHPYAYASGLPSAGATILATVYPSTFLLPILQSYNYLLT